MVNRGIKQNIKMNKIEVLGVKIDDISINDLLKSVEIYIDNNRKCLIYTVNNEFVVETQHNKKFLEVLNRSTYSIADSTGIVWAIKKLHSQNIERIPGADLFIDLASVCAKKGYGIFLLGGEKGVAGLAADELKKKFPKINICGILDGVEIDPNTVSEDIVKKINDSKCDIVCVALGAPKQEFWIDGNFKKVNAKVFIGIGGTLDYVSGKIKRAPNAMRKMGLEWLYRFLRQPSRGNRIKNALITFPKLVRKELNRT